MRILALATNPATGASTRFRVLQWEPYLRQAGFSLALDSFCSILGSQVLYQPRRYIEKSAYCLLGGIRRVAVMARASEVADVLFIHREAFPLGLRVMFRAIEQFPGVVVYDHDDAMFLPQRQGRGLMARLENTDTPSQLMQMSDVVFVGNTFLEHYARQHARRVVLLPTCIDTERFRPRHDPPLDVGRPVVGWIGSHTTTKYLESMIPILETVGRAVPFRLVVVGNARPITVRGIEVHQAPWTLEREVEQFHQCDIGIYPLWSDLWAQGKCGFKAIQFMACGIPVVAAAVGVNQEIIQDGLNGFLAATEEDWVHKLERLLREPGLRQRMGWAGRKTVEERYATAVHAPTLIGSLCDAIERKRGGAKAVSAGRVLESARKVAQPAVRIGGPQ